MGTVLPPDSPGLIAGPVVEKAPDGKSQHEAGAKLDFGKAPVRRGVLEYFPRAVLAVANLSAAGARKYAWKGWESVENGIDRYGDAGARHICKAAIEGEYDSEWFPLGEEVFHATAEAWNALARLELILREKEKQTQQAA